MLESPLEAWCHDYKTNRMVFMAQMSLRTLETNSQELKMGSSVDDRSKYSTIKQSMQYICCKSPGELALFHWPLASLTIAQKYFTTIHR